MNQKQNFIEMKEREFQTTLKVLKAYPKDKQDLKPHAVKSRSALELVRNFAAEEQMSMGIAQGEVDMSKMVKPEGDIDQAISDYEKFHKESMKIISGISPEDLMKDFDFFGIKMTRMSALWMMLMDMVHHRGQFSVYIRLADGKVPMIYGPTADEPWQGKM